MEHVVYLDAQAKEIEKMLFGSKTMIMRGAAGWKLPHGRVHAGDMLFFINNNAGGKDLLFPGHLGGYRFHPAPGELGLDRSPVLKTSRKDRGPYVYNLCHRNP